MGGRTRDERVMLSDGTIASEPVLRKVDGEPFMQGSLIADALERITGKVRDEDYLRGLSREEFSNRAAALMVELNGVHPFREGNGRTQRVFITELAQETGHKLDFSCVTRERMIQASIAGNEKNDPAIMQRLFNEISDPLRVAALSKAIDSLEQHGGEQFMARTKTAILIGQTRDLPEPPPERGQDFTLASTSWLPLYIVVRVRELECNEDDLFWETELRESAEPPDWLDGYYSTEEKTQIKALFKEYGLPWSEPQTCMLVTFDLKDERISASAAGGYGVLLRLNVESVLPDIGVVCSEDIKTAIGSGHSIEVFTDLQKMSVNEKRSALMEAADRARSDGNAHYAEALLYRALKKSDFWTPFQEAILD